MNWDLISQIATSLGVLLAAASLGGGFFLYRLTQRDEQAGQFRLMLAGAQSRVEHLKDLVSYELARELAGTVVYSADLDLPLRDLYEFFRPKSGEKPSEEDGEKYLDSRFPVLTVPLNTPLVRDYQSGAIAVKSEAAPYQKSHPGLFRVLDANAQILSNILRNEKEIARDEDLWKAVLPKIVADSDRVPSFDHMKLLLADVITLSVMQHMQSSERQIDLLGKMLALVADIYLDQSPRDLGRISRRERSPKVTPTTMTDRISEDLREAEKCLLPIFPKEAQRRDFHLLLTEFIATTRASGDDEAEDGERV